MGVRMRKRKTCSSTFVRSPTSKQTNKQKKRKENQHQTQSNEQINAQFVHFYAFIHTHTHTKTFHLTKYSRRCDGRPLPLFFSFRMYSSVFHFCFLCAHLVSLDGVRDSSRQRKSNQTTFRLRSEGVCLWLRADNRCSLQKSEQTKGASSTFTTAARHYTFFVSPRSPRNLFGPILFFVLYVCAFPGKICC